MTNAKHKQSRVALVADAGCELFRVAHPVDGREGCQPQYALASDADSVPAGDGSFQHDESDDVVGGVKAWYVW